MQGSVLGPILYLICTLPFGDITRRHSLEYHFYANDSQLYLAFETMTNNQTVSLARIESCVTERDAWMVQNKLKLNRSKKDLLMLSD